MERIHDLNRYQKMLLIALIVMALVFGAVYHAVTARAGYLYEDTILLPSEQGGDRLYSGTIDGRACTFTVAADGTVTLRHGDRVYGPYTVREDPTAKPEDEPYMTGVEILDGEQVFFRGGYWPSTDGFVLFNEEGGIMMDIYAYTADGTTYDADGNIVVSNIVADNQSQEDKQSADDMNYINQKVAEKSGQAGKMVTHKVKAGETLSSIAKMYGVDPLEIKEQNHLRRSAVRTGQQLRITAKVLPEGGDYQVLQTEAKNVSTQQATQQTSTKKKESASTSTKQKSKSSTKKKSSTKTTHKVKSGESLAKIASKYGVTVNELKKANNLKGNTIHPGDKLKVPSKKKSKSKKKKR